MISGGVLRGPAPLSLDWGVGRAPLADVFVGRRGNLWLWWPSSLALRRGLARRALLRGNLGLRWKNHEGSDPAVHGGVDGGGGGEGQARQNIL